MTGQQDIAEIDLMDAVRDVAGARRTLLAALVIVLLATILIVNFAHKSYLADAELVPAGNGGEASGTQSELMGAASMLGVNLGQTDDSDFTEYKDLLSSTRLAAALYRDDTVKAILFPSAWDADKHQWKEPSQISAAGRWILRGLTGKPAWSPPGPFDVEKYLDNNLTILSDKVTGFFKVSIEEDTPEKATILLRTIIGTADDLMRDTVKARAMARIAYLNKALKSATQEDQRRTMIDLLSAQEKMLMLASADPTYAVKVIDPPSADPMPASPAFLKVLLLGIFLALVAVSTWAVLRGYFFVRRGTSGLDPSLDAAIADWARRMRRKIARKKDTQLASS